MGRAGPFFEIKIWEAGWMYKLSGVYLYLFNGQLIIHMILYFVCKVIPCKF